MFSILVLSVFATTGLAAAQGVYKSGTVGNDVSYPNCSIKAPSSAFGIVGVTGGLNFAPNNCIQSEALWFKNLTLYANTGYPGLSAGQNYQLSPNNCLDGDLTCIAYNYGYNAGLYAYNYAASKYVSSTTWWLDVETMNSWTTDTAQNVASLQGEINALKDNGVTSVGIYSTTYQWGVITGSWQNGLPNWGATTWRKASQAAKYCTGHDFTGGGTWLLQFSGKIDQDYAC